MCVEDNLRMGCEGLDASAMEDAVRRAMRDFPLLEDRRRQRAATLSGGEQQMLAIARGLCRRPRLLLLDEMSQGLAPIVVAELFGRVDAIRRSGTAVLLVEQYAAAALDVADDVYVIEKGRIVFHGTPAQLRSDERAMREAYLGSAESVGRLRNDAGDRPTEEVVIRISPRLRRRYERLAADLGTTVGDQVRAALAAHLLQPDSPRNGSTAGRTAGESADRGGDAKPRLAALEPGERTEDQRQLLSAVGGDNAPNVFSTVVRHPALFRTWLPFCLQLLTHSAFPPRERELLIIRTAWLCGSAYELEHHLDIGARAGMTDHDLAAAVTDEASEPRAPRERLLLAAADELHLNHVISDGTWRELSALLTTEQLIELPMLVGHYILLAGTLRTLGVALERELPVTDAAQ
jgi:alkylhydroperoxidase family enzyme